MTMLDAARLLSLTEATWPAVRRHAVGPWVIREGKGSGRVCAATGNGGAADLRMAEDAMRALGQPCLFMVDHGATALDDVLAAAGYQKRDPVVLYAAQTAALKTDEDEKPETYTCWPPLAVQEEIWEAAGFSPDRRGVMDRVRGASTSIMARGGDRIGGTLFAAVDGDLAMVHAVETLQKFRRRGLARQMLRRAALWADEQGADHLALAVLESNGPARALYASLGMRLVGQYHYRILPE